MARVTVAEVKQIIEIDSTISDTDLGVFITAANLVVTNTCIDSALDDTTLKEIERWLSAHFIAIRDMRSDSEKAGEVSIKYQYKLGLRLEVTMYGQQAMLLDFSGALSALNNQKRKVVFSYIGGVVTESAT